MTNSTKRTSKNVVQLDQPDLGPVEQIAIDLLKPFANNARTHDERKR